jgi:hypothetical protein
MIHMAAASFLSVSLFAVKLDSVAAGRWFYVKGKRGRCLTANGLKRYGNTIGEQLRRAFVALASVRESDHGAGSLPMELQYERARDQHLGLAMDLSREN